MHQVNSLLYSAESNTIVIPALDEKDSISRIACPPLRADRTARGLREELYR